VTVLKTLVEFEKFFRLSNDSSDLLVRMREVPVYTPKFLVSLPEEGLLINFSAETSRELLEDVNYLVI
jgi:hypothetical protein